MTQGNNDDRRQTPRTRSEKKPLNVAAAMEAFAEQFEHARKNSTIDQIIDDYSQKLAKAVPLEHAVLCYANAYARSKLTPKGVFSMDTFEKMVRDYDGKDMDADELMQEIRRVSKLALNACGVTVAGKSR